MITTKLPRVEKSCGFFTHTSFKTEHFIIKIVVDEICLQTRTFQHCQSSSNNSNFSALITRFIDRTPYVNSHKYNYKYDFVLTRLTN